MCGRSVLGGGQQPRLRTPPQGTGSQRSPILGFTSIYAFIICRRSTKIEVVTHGKCEITLWFVNILNLNIARLCVGTMLCEVDNF